MAAERILVVDDEELNRDLLQQILEREGYQVAIAAMGRKPWLCSDKRRFT